MLGKVGNHIGREKDVLRRREGCAETEGRMHRDRGKDVWRWREGCAGVLYTRLGTPADGKPPAQNLADMVSWTVSV
jgi:hypothetical protein